MRDHGIDVSIGVVAQQIVVLLEQPRRALSAPVRRQERARQMRIEGKEVAILVDQLEAPDVGALRRQRPVVLRREVVQEGPIEAPDESRIAPAHSSEIPAARDQSPGLRESHVLGPKDLDLPLDSQLGDELRDRLVNVVGADPDPASEGAAAEPGEAHTESVPKLSVFLWDRVGDEIP